MQEKNFYKYKFYKGRMPILQGNTYVFFNQSNFSRCFKISKVDREPAKMLSQEVHVQLQQPSPPFY